MSSNQILNPAPDIGILLAQAIVSGMRFKNDQEIREYLKSQGADIVIAPPPPPCPYLQAEGEKCSDGYHGALGKRWRCQGIEINETKARIKPEKERLSGLLKKCGYDPQTKPDQKDKIISNCLYDLIDENRPVQNLNRLLDSIANLCANPPPKCNVAFLGPQGLAKTTAQLAIHFAQLEAGIKSYFVDSIYLRNLFKKLSFIRDEYELRAIREEFNALAKAQVILWSDAGDTRSSYPTEFAENLKHLVEYSPAVWILSSNLDKESLSKHADFGRSITSRLFADRNGIPAEIIELLGEDQRSHESRNREKWGKIIEFRQPEDEK